jgi:hypothetical protein
LVQELKDVIAEISKSIALFPSSSLLALKILFKKEEKTHSWTEGHVATPLASSD